LAKWIRVGIVIIVLLSLVLIFLLLRNTAESSLNSGIMPVISGEVGRLPVFLELRAAFAVPAAQTLLVTIRYD
jgi:hypothetical protein